MAYTKELEALLGHLKNDITTNITDSDEFKDLLDKIDIKLRLKYGLVWADDLKEKVLSTLTDNFVVLNQKEEYCLLNGISNRYTTPVVLMEGDNIDSLTSLKIAKKKFDVIYIDPPYNTLNEKGFRYNDKMVDETDEFRHSKWLDFMKNRLDIAINLLNDCGVVLISIDENEFAQLKLLCDKIFGEKNFVCNFVWINSNRESEDGTLAVNGNNAGHFKKGHEYILCYTNNKNKFRFNKLSKGKNDTLTREITKNGNAITEIKLKAGTIFNNKISKKFKNYVGGEKERIYIKEGILDVVNGVLQSDVILEGPFGNRNVWVERFLNGEEVYDTKNQRILDLTITNTGVIKFIKEKHGEIISDVISNVGSVSSSTKYLNETLCIDTGTMYPKPVELIKYLIKATSKHDSCILDFFAGSGTTGQAVLELNLEDGGHRQVFLCTNNEVQQDIAIKFLQNKNLIPLEPANVKKSDPIYKEWYKLALSYLNSSKFKEIEKSEEFKSLGICRSITYQRCKKIINGFTDSSGKLVEAIGGQLVYFICNTIPKKVENPIDYDMYSTKQLKASIEYIMILESCYTSENLSENIVKLSNENGKKILVNLNNIDTDEDYHLVLKHMTDTTILYVTNGLFESEEYSVFKENLTVIPDTFFRYYE